ncbi:hypothetical protein QA596_12085 [Balneolales bacterium ANBcel1]|nr:hypothetical protein [Balneolales bacterium ANBcel1]
MLRILLIIIIAYLVIRIALRLLLSESPSQRRNRVNSAGNYGQPNGDPRFSRGKKTGRSRFDHIEDAEFEEIPDKSSRKKK